MEETGRRQGGRLRQLAAAALCVAAITLCAQGIVELVRQRSEDLIPSMAMQASRSVQGVENLMHWRNVGFALQYLSAGVDAAIRDETGLHLSAAQLLAVLSALPQEADITLMELHSGTLYLYCTSSSPAQAHTLCEALRSSGAFGAVEWYGTGWEGERLSFCVEAAAAQADAQPLLPVIQGRQ